MLWLLMKRSNQATAAYPMTKAIRVATNNCRPVALMPSVTGWKASGSENSPEASTAGIASKNPNRAEAGLSSPRNNPALIVAPDRETPGISANACALPTITASFMVNCSVWRT